MEKHNYKVFLRDCMDEDVVSMTEFRSPHFAKSDYDDMSNDMVLYAKLSFYYNWDLTRTKGFQLLKSSIFVDLDELMMVYLHSTIHGEMINMKLIINNSVIRSFSVKCYKYDFGF